MSREPRSLASEKGFSLLEALVAIGVAIFFIYISQSALVAYLTQSKEQEKILMTKVLLSQVIADLSVNWTKYPVLLIGGAPGSYVQCYDKTLTLVIFPGATEVNIQKTNAIQTAAPKYITQCSLNYEVRIEVSSVAPQTQYHISILTQDPRTPGFSILRMVTDLYRAQGN